MEPSGPATPTAASGVRSAFVPERLIRVWMRLRSASRRRNRTIDSLSDHLLADAGLNGSGYEQMTWERYIHR